MSRIIPYVRIYFERSNGMAVADYGPGTRRHEATHVRMEGQFYGEHGPADVRPRFWIVARNAVVQVIGDVIYVTSMEG